jgi:hypothetical protein
MFCLFCTSDVQVAGVRTTGFAPAATTSTSRSAPPATCATATSPGPLITRYSQLLLAVLDSNHPLAWLRACYVLGVLHLPSAAVAFCLEGYADSTPLLGAGAVHAAGDASVHVPHRGSSPVWLQPL